jgi:hypothetical protein
MTRAFHSIHPHKTDHITVDPWFNFRATKHLVAHGFYSFWDWFDDSKTYEIVADK